MSQTVKPAISAIHLEGVSKVFGKPGTDAAYRAVDDLNLDVDPGQMLAILGKTGCGKSTIFNMIAGLTEPTSGIVRVQGRDPFSDFPAISVEQWAARVTRKHGRVERVDLTRDLRLLVDVRAAGAFHPTHPGGQGRASGFAGVAMPVVAVIGGRSLAGIVMRFTRFGIA